MIWEKSNPNDAPTTCFKVFGFRWILQFRSSLEAPKHVPARPPKCFLHDGRQPELLQVNYKGVMLGRVWQWRRDGGYNNGYFDDEIDDSNQLNIRKMMISYIFINYGMVFCVVSKQTHMKDIEILGSIRWCKGFNCDISLTRKRHEHQTSTRCIMFYSTIICIYIYIRLSRLSWFSDSKNNPTLSWFIIIRCDFCNICVLFDCFPISSLPAVPCIVARLPHKVERNAKRLAAC